MLALERRLHGDAPAPARSCVAPRRPGPERVRSSSVLWSARPLLNASRAVGVVHPVPGERARAGRARRRCVPSARMRQRAAWSRRSAPATARTAGAAPARGRGTPVATADRLGERDLIAVDGSGSGLQRRQRQRPGTSRRACPTRTVVEPITRPGVARRTRRRRSGSPSTSAHTASRLGEADLVLGGTACVHLGRPWAHLVWRRFVPVREPEIHALAQWTCQRLGWNPRHASWPVARCASAGTPTNPASDVSRAGVDRRAADTAAHNPSMIKPRRPPNVSPCQRSDPAGHRRA